MPAAEFKSVNRHQLQKAFALAHRGAGNNSVNLEGRKRLRLIARLIWDSCGEGGPYRNRLDSEAEAALTALSDEALV